jgi:hypothetical protein
LRGSTHFDNARDELFAHIHRCNVLRADDVQKQEWMEDTIGFIAERYPQLSEEQLDELQAIGMRFCQPVIPHGKEHTALTADGTETAVASEEGSLAAAV